MPVRSGRYNPPRLKPHVPKLKWIMGALAFLFLAAFIFILNAGTFLVREDPFDHINWALVLDGEDRDCDRSDAALELYLENKIDSIILSGVRTYKTHYRSEFIRPTLIERGVKAGHVYEMRNDSYSTIEEAELAIQLFRQLNLDSVLIITSNFHTSRTSYIYNYIAKGNPVCLVYPSVYLHYNPRAWWASRTSMKTFVLEATKYVQSALELWWTSARGGYQLEGVPLTLHPRDPLQREFSDSAGLNIVMEEKQIPLDTDAPATDSSLQDSLPQKPDSLNFDSIAN